MTIEERSTGLEARPDMSGIETGSLNFGRDLFPTLPHETEGIAARAAELGIPLEVEAFEIGHIDAALDFARRGVLPTPLRINIVVGCPGALAATSHNLCRGGRRAARGRDLVRDRDRAPPDAHADARAAARRDLRARRLRGQRLPAPGAPAPSRTPRWSSRSPASRAASAARPATVEQARELLSLPRLRASRDELPDLRRHRRDVHRRRRRRRGGRLHARQGAHRRARAPSRASTRARARSAPASGSPSAELLARTDVLHVRDDARHECDRRGHDGAHGVLHDGGLSRTSCCCARAASSTRSSRSRTRRRTSRAG